MTRANRFDAQDQYFLSNQLQSFDPTSYYHLVPGVVGRRIIPAVEGVSRNMPVYKFKMVRLRGQVKLGGPRSKGQPSVSAVRTEETQAIKVLEDEMTYNIDELRAAQEANQDLPKDTQLAAVTAIEQKIDSMLATGDTLSGIPGIANNANIGSTNATATWLAAATPDQIIGDVTNIISLTQDALKQGQIPGTEIPFFDQFSLYLPVKHLTKIMTTRLGATNDITIYKFIMENFAMLKAIRPWWRLDTANAGGPMAVLVPALDDGRMNPFAGGALLPMDFEQLPEQFDGRDINIPCAGKCGGVVVRHPVAFRYLKVM